MTPAKRSTAASAHILVDTLGLLLVVVIHTANIQDRDGLALVCRRLRRRFPWLRLIFADGGYQGETAACAAAQERLRLQIVNVSPAPAALPSYPSAGWSRGPSLGSAAIAGWPRVRGNPRLGRHHGPPRLDPAPRPAPRKSLRSVGAFADGQLGSAGFLLPPASSQCRTVCDHGRCGLRRNAESSTPLITRAAWGWPIQPALATMRALDGATTAPPSGVSRTCRSISRNGKAEYQSASAPRACREATEGGPQPRCRVGRTSHRQPLRPGPRSRGCHHSAT